MKKTKQQWCKVYLPAIICICLGSILCVTIVFLYKKDHTYNNEKQSNEVVNLTKAVTSLNTTEYEEKNLFKESVFVGDSIMYGFEKYVTKNDIKLLKGADFLTIGNFAARLNLEPVSDKSTHPIYKGVKCTIEQAVFDMGAKKVFLFFGMNDIGITGIDGALENYYKCIQNIKELSGNIQIYIISITYMAKGSEKTVLNNENIRIFNEKLKENSEIWGVNYIDLASPLADSSGYLSDKYCSDNYVHLTDSAYQVWIDELKIFAEVEN